MNQSKLNILKDTFEKKFDIERFQKFTREFFNEPTMLPGNRKVGIWREYDNYINSYYLIANYKDGDNNSILVMAVELKRNISVEKARSMQRNFISKVLYENNYEAAIVAFYTEDSLNWRLSLVRLDYSLTSTGIKLDLTPAKRYSYLVGEGEPNNTAQTQLLKIFEDDEHNPTLEEIEEAFSVEKVTKDFFDSYREKYLDLKEHLEKTDSFISEAKKLGLETNKFAEQFSKKLMGQLAFLYFLQKKGWLGVRLLPKDRTLSQEEFKEIYTLQTQDKRNVLSKAFKQDIDRSFKSSATYLHELSEDEAGLLSDCFINTKYNMPWGSGDKKFIIKLFNFCNDETDLNFFHDYLEPFFYDALNKNRVNDYYKRFNCKIPFLNGGLFEPLEGYHWKDIGLKIPNYIFSNEKEKGREAEGILDVFERYNFTMNEDEPLDKEVAIDPEMLGKIFENLLEVSDRKSKGAFYTPREIVHYMCQESIINYLVNSTGVPYEDMKEFILYGEMIKDADNRRAVISGSKELAIKPSIYENIVDIDAALKNVKIADPAVGSGAFPLGMLNEIVKARKNITEYIIKVNKEGEFGEKYDEKFIRSRRSEYTMKIDTIKNSIFAVDIEPSAVDIAKLRLWLSVVVDQEIDENNPRPHVLPNLDENIKVGDSLIDVFEGIELFDKSILNKDSSKDKNMDLATQMNLLLDSSDILINQMFTLQESYFNEDDESRKQELKIKIDKIRNDLIEYKLQRDGNIEGLRRYEESLKNKTKPYFIWELEFARVFKENGGFDIVIGNPPYLESRSPNFDDKTKDILQQIIKNRHGNNAKFIPRGADLLIYFFELSLRIMKGNGVNTFITQNSWLDTEYGKKFQDYLTRTTNILAVIDSDFKYFENANINTVITIFEGNEGYNKDIMFARCHTSLREYSLPIDNSLISNMNATVKVFANSNPLIKELKWGFIFDSSPLLIKTIDKCSKLGKRVEQLNGDFSIGQGLNLTKSYYVDCEVVKELNISHEDLIPIMTVKESGVYEWNKTQTYLVDDSIISGDTRNKLKRNNILPFESKKTSKGKPILILPRGIGTKHYCSYNKMDGYTASFVDIYKNSDLISNQDVLNMWIFLNSTLAWLIREVSGRKNLGGGMLKAEAVDLKSFPIHFEFDNIEVINNIYREASNHEIQGAAVEMFSPIHKEIDTIVYDYIGLSNEERDELSNLFLKKFDSRISKASNK